MRLREENLYYHLHMDLNHWIHAARKHGKLTQQQLADRLSVSKSNVSAWETGKHEPSFSQIRVIAQETGFPTPFEQTDEKSGPGTPEVSIEQAVQALAETVMAMPDAGQRSASLALQILANTPSAWKTVAATLRELTEKASGEISTPSASQSPPKRYG